MRNRGSILVGLLWCLALLSLVVIGVLHTSRSDLTVMRLYGDRVQARYLALAGIERTKALLFRDAQERSHSGRNHTGELYDDPSRLKDVAFGRGRYRVMRGGSVDEGGGVVFGVSDEESRLNVNVADLGELGKLVGMTSDVLAALGDWRDSDNNPSPAGAELEYYTSQRPPALPRNGPLPTLRELLMVRGMPRELLLGTDLQASGLPELPESEPGESAEASAASSRSGGPAFDAGWMGLLTVASGVDNVSGSGVKRVNVQSADETALTGVKGISQDIAKAIVSSRGQNKIESLADLLEVRAASNQGGGRGGRGNPGGGGGGAPVIDPATGQPIPQPGGGGGQANNGPRVIDENLLIEIADELTTVDGEKLNGVVNVNTASVEVLRCLPGMTRELAQALVTYRRSNGFLPNVAWLLRVPGFNREIFKQLAPRVTVRSETFTILCEGRITSTGVRQRIQQVVHVSLQGVETLAYREDDL